MKLGDATITDLCNETFVEANLSKPHVSGDAPGVTGHAPPQDSSGGVTVMAGHLPGRGFESLPESLSVSFLPFLSLYFEQSNPKMFISNSAASFL